MGLYSRRRGRDCGSGGFILNRQPLTKWLTDRAAVKAGTGRAIAVLAGDSSQASYGADNVANFQAVNAMDARLARQFTTEGLPSTYQSLWGGKGAVSLSNWDFRAAQGAFAYGNVGSFGITLGGEFFTAGAAATLSFTPADQTQAAVSTDTAVFYYCQDPSAGGVTKQIDAGTATAVNENGTSQVLPTTQTATLGAHTMKWNWASGQANLIGIRCYNSAVKAVDFMNMGCVGAWAAQWADTTYKWMPANAWSAVAPSIVFFAAGANDWLGGTALSTVKASMKAAVQAIQAAGASVVIVGYSPIGLDYSAITTVQGQMDLRDVQIQVAVECNCTFLDVLMMMGGPSAYAANFAAGLMQNDKLHRTFNGMTPQVNLMHDLMVA